MKDELNIYKLYCETRRHHEFDEDDDEYLNAMQRINPLKVEERASKHNPRYKVQVFYVDGKRITTEEDAFDDKVEKRWLTFKDGLLHSFNDEPAQWYYGGTNRGVKEWYSNGVIHREHGPAIVDDSGVQEWYRNGFRHRDDGPASIVDRHNHQEERYYNNGLPHRLDGPALVLNLHGNVLKQYALNGKWYENEPAQKKAWAQRALQMQNKPSDDKSVTKYLLQMDAQQTADEI